MVQNETSWLSEQARTAAEMALGPCTCFAVKDIRADKHYDIECAFRFGLPESVATAMEDLARAFAERACIEYGRLGIISPGMIPPNRIAAAIAEADRP